MDPPKISKTVVEAKSHGLRNAQEKDKVPCPFPDRYGGKDKCGVCDEDGADEVLMASCAALAMLVSLDLGFLFLPMSGSPVSHRLDHHDSPSG